MKLYEINAEFAELMEIAMDPDIDQQVIQDTLESIKGERDEKFDACAHVITNIEADAELDKAEAAIFKKQYEAVMARAKAKENAAKRIKNGMMRSMILTGDTKVKTREHTYYIQKSYSIGEFDETQVPFEFWKAKDPELDKVALLKFLKAQEEPVPWAELKVEEGLRMR